MLLEEHRANNVKMHTKVSLKALKADAEGKVTHAELSNGSVIETELVLVAAGVRPATAFLKDSGIEIEVDGGIKLDPFLQTNDKHIFAAGDIASYPYWPTGKQ
jgi:NADPH-dependent 2,4-dienoyl-CoA reductase/sulfur reductase-like enzyme